MREWKWAIAPVLVAALAGPVHADDDTERVRAVLRDHPEILVEALRQQGPALLEIIETSARNRQREMERARFAAELAKPLKPALDVSRASIGPQDAAVTIVEYSDFLCHFCAQASETVKKLTQNHPKDVRLVFKHFATGKNDVRAALYFEAINLQDPKKAWAFLDKAFARQKDVSEKGDEALAAMAKEVGADMDRLAKDLERKDLSDRIAADVKEARDFGFTGTPIFLVNGAAVRGAVPLEALEEFVAVAKDPKAASSAKKP
ncbi:thioredoxin domain-containing protein [Solidesulfovibrio sp.]|uniref:DsbA family protein n=1 Tax=Solidesulfovibrio sp. TaxID=2910990 RepID=UPI002610FF77|nr:thioredoxin domain-containing protein [Solidesulfovibrio sp.]